MGRLHSGFNIVLMTDHALNAGIGEFSLCVASSTTGLLVLTQQWEAGSEIMPPRSEFPGSRRVALTALEPQPGFVNIILSVCPMAGLAVAECPQHLLLQVAIIAGNLLVATRQRVAGK